MKTGAHPGSDVEVEAQAEAEADRLVAQYPSEVLDALIRVLRERVPARIGRPTGSGQDDDALLEQMEELLANGQASSVTDAARQVARIHPGHSEEATKHRLRRKYSERQQEESESDSGPKQWPEEIEQYFDQDVELWEL